MRICESAALRRDWSAAIYNGKSSTLMFLSSNRTTYLFTQAYTSAPGGSWLNIPSSSHSVTLRVR